mgnify:CR=1 FL=1
MSESAAQVIARAGGAIPALRNAPDRPAIFPVTPEFTNWRSEQRAWRDGVALLDQSHHMTDLFISGPDALKLLSDTGVNNFSRFTVGDAKQFVAVNYEGYLVGDAVLFYLAENRFDLVGWYMVIDWVQFIGETGDYDVTFERDANSIMRDPGKDPVRSSSGRTRSPSPASRSTRCVTAWRGSPDSSSSGRGRSARVCARRS